jgi:antitoxin Phd
LGIILIEVIIMMVNTNVLVPMTDANQNFSKVVRMVDEDGMAVILKNNKPRYVVVDFDEYDTIAAAIQMRKAKIESTADKIIENNMEAFLELGK